MNSAFAHDSRTGSPRWEAPRLCPAARRALSLLRWQRMLSRIAPDRCGRRASGTAHMRPHRGAAASCRSISHLPQSQPRRSAPFLQRRPRFWRGCRTLA